jgi:hypothetical protein
MSSSLLRADQVGVVEATPVIRPSRVEVAPIVDGDVLEDPAYAAVEPAMGFSQQAPYEGEPASENTEIYVVYTADTLYFGVVC